MKRTVWDTNTLIISCWSPHYLPRELTLPLPSLLFTSWQKTNTMDFTFKQTSPIIIIPFLLRKKRTGSYSSKHWRRIQGHSPAFTLDFKIIPVYSYHIICCWNTNRDTNRDTKTITLWPEAAVSSLQDCFEHTDVRTMWWSLTLSLHHSQGLLLLSNSISPTRAHGSVISGRIVPPPLITSNNIDTLNKAFKTVRGNSKGCSTPWWPSADSDRCGCEQNPA